MNTQKALELLELPSEAGAFEGQIRSKISRYIVIDEKYDFTQMVGGKPTITKTWRIGQRTEAFGLYVFNYLNSLLHSFGYEVVSASSDGIETLKPFDIRSVLTGPFAGQSYWYGEQRAYVTASGVDLAVSPYQNATSTGLPTNYQTAPTRSGVVYVQQWSKTSKTGGFVAMGSMKVKNMNRVDFELLTGMNEQDAAYATRTSFVRTAVDNTTHITSMAVDIEENAGKYSGVLYLNGEKHNTINAASMMTCYGKLWPSFVFDWRLYNDAPPAGTTTGASVQFRFQASEDNTIEIVGGTADEYDSVNKILTYNAANPNLAKVIAYVECMPATGKQENVARWFYPEIGLLQSEANWN